MRVLLAILRFLFRTLLRLVPPTTLCAVGVAVYVATLLPGLPTIDEIRRVPLNIPLRIYSADGDLIGQYGNERRIPVSLDETPLLLIDAILVTEDDRFYHHSGVDFRGIARAVVSNLRSQSRAQGASTITMQVARNFFLTPERTYKRKLREILLAFNMERALTKDEILELYLNKIFLGHRSYGFAAASRVYYGVAMKNLSVPQVAMLAGLPKAPSRDNPITNSKRAAQRRAYVLKRMHEQGKIDALSYQTALAAPVTANRHMVEGESQAPFVAELVRRMMVDRFGERVYELGYEVEVTVNSDYQTHAEAALRAGLLAYDRRHGFRGAVGNIAPSELESKSPTELLRDYPSSRELIPAIVLDNSDRQLRAVTRTDKTIDIKWRYIQWARAYLTPNRTTSAPTSSDEVAAIGDVVYVARNQLGEWELAQMPEISGALVSMDPNSGAILALTGGFDYYLSKFNRATQARRQPGSNIKPFIYSAALDNGFTAGSLVSAMPIVIEDNLEGIWSPQNFGRKFYGPTRLREALSRSLNLVSVRLLRAIGIDATVNHLAKFGFDRDKLPRSFSLALGSLSVTPLDLAAGFAVFANGGKRVRPYLIARITDGEGNAIELSGDWCSDCENAHLLPRANPHVDEQDRVISAQNAFIVSDMLRQVILTGTGQRARALGRDDLAGKTGTTNDFRDAWFSGFNRDIVTTVFVGFDEPSNLGRRESGASAALPIWVEYMRDVLKKMPEQPFEPPANIVTQLINKTSGEPTVIGDPDAYVEYFIAGSQPEIPLDNRDESVDQPPPENNAEGLF